MRDCPTPALAGKGPIILSSRAAAKTCKDHPFGGVSQISVFGPDLSPGAHTAVDYSTFREGACLNRYLKFNRQSCLTFLLLAASPLACPLSANLVFAPLGLKPCNLVSVLDLPRFWPQPNQSTNLVCSTLRVNPESGHPGPWSKANTISGLRYYSSQPD